MVFIKAACRGSQGMTLLEVMIATVILVVAAFAMFDLSFSLNRTQKVTDIERQVASLGQILRERFMGTTGSQLGGWVNATSGDATHGGLYWHRRMTPRQADLKAGYTPKGLVTSTSATLSPRLPPLQEGSIYGHDHDLLYQLATPEQRSAMDAGGKGMESFHIPNLRVFVEYYNKSVIVDTMATADPVAAWKALVNNPAVETHIVPESPGGVAPSPFATDLTTTYMNLSGMENFNSVCVRIIIQWWNDGESTIVHEQEIVFVRRV